MEDSGKSLLGGELSKNFSDFLGFPTEGFKEEILKPMGRIKDRRSNLKGRELKVLQDLVGNSEN